MNDDAFDRRLVTTLRGQALSPPPIWLMRQAGRYLPEYRALRQQEPNFVDFCLNPDLAVEATLQPLRRYAFDAAIVFADILLLPHGAGRPVTFVESEGPRFSPIETLDDVRALDWARAREVCAPVSVSVSRLRAALDPNVALIGFAGAPWTVATYLLGGRGGDDGRRKAVVKGAGDPALITRLLDDLADATATYLVDQARAGADVLMLFESWAGAAPAGQFDAWVIAPTRRIVDRVKASGVTAPIMGFPRGAGALAIDYAERAGVDAISLDSSQAASRLVEALPAALPVQGGLDPALLIAGGAALDDEVDRLLSLFAGRPYIFNLGHGITPDTPSENVARLVERVKGAAQT